MYIYIYVSLHMYIYIYIYIYVFCVSLYIYISIYLYGLCICIHIYIHILYIVVIYTWVTAYTDFFLECTAEHVAFRTWSTLWCLTSSSLILKVIKRCTVQYPSVDMAMSYRWENHPLYWWGVSCHDWCMEL